MTKAPKLRKEDGQIDWSRPARCIHNLVRAMQPWPLASTTLYPRAGDPKDPTRIIVQRTAVVPGRGATRRSHRERRRSTAHRRR